MILIERNVFPTRWKMVKVLIYGTGSSAKKLLEVLDYNKVEIVAFIDGNCNKQQLLFEEKYNIFPPKKIKELTFDKIIVASMYYDEIIQTLKGLKVDKDKCFWFNVEYFNAYLSEVALNSKFGQLSLAEESIEIIATGLSYVRDGLDFSFLNYKGINFGFSSQDLFADYSIIEHIFSNYKLSNLKYLLIGMSYYSFNYDLSKSINGYLTTRYYGITKTMRSYNIEKDYYYFRDFTKTFFNKENIQNISSNDKNNMYYECMTEIDKHNGKQVATRHSKKIYPETISENKYLFSKILELCKMRNITPIVVVFPTTKYYYDYLSIDMEEHFLKIIEEFQKQYKFLFYNFLKDSSFEEQDFWDASHLNYRGAKKFSLLH